MILRYCNEAGESHRSRQSQRAADNIAGICNRERNVFGLMPHPERACDARLGSTDGRAIFEWVLAKLGARAAA